MADSERIEISMEDLAEPADGRPEPPVNPPAVDATTRPLPRMPKAPSPRPILPPTPSTGATLGTKLGANTVIVGLVAGVIAGLAGSLVAEAVNQAFLADRTDVHEGVLAGVVGTLLGFLLAAWPDLSIGSVRRGLREGAIGAVIGATAALAALGVADSVYNSIREGADTDAGPLKLAILLAWIIIGTLAGAGLGLRGGFRKVANGALGGFIGGAAGGLLYIQLAGEETSAFGPQTLAVVATTTGIAVAIGIVERIRREAWLQIVAGPLAGKEFILYRDQVVIGSTAAADIVVTKDASVLPVHARLLRSPDQTILRAEPGATVLINGRAASDARVRDGDTLQIGSTQILYSER